MSKPSKQTLSNTIILFCFIVAAYGIWGIVLTFYTSANFRTLSSSDFPLFNTLMDQAYYSNGLFALTVASAAFVLFSLYQLSLKEKAHLNHNHHH